MEQGRGIQVASKEKVDKIFCFLMRNVNHFLGGRFEVEVAGDLALEIEEVFQELVLDLPFIGGEKNPLTGTLIWSSVWLAVYEVLHGHGVSASEVGKMIYDDFRLTTERFTVEELQKVQENRFSTEYLEEQRQFALESQKRLYPGDWEFYFVEGDGESFDWGLDYTECAICEFYRKHGADELMPYICLTDFYSSEMLGLGLERTETIADGARVCNFRYKRGRNTSLDKMPVFFQRAR